MIDQIVFLRRAHASKAVAFSYCVRSLPTIKMRFMRDPEDLRKFAHVDYSAIARLKADYWRAFKEQYGAAAALYINDELRKQVIAQRPDWPTPKDRREDHAAHLRVHRLIERASAILRPGTTG